MCWAPLQSSVQKVRQCWGAKAKWNIVFPELSILLCHVVRIHSSRWSYFICSC